MKNRRLFSALAAFLLTLWLYDPAAPRTELVYAQGGNVELVSGWTGPLDFRLLADGAAINLTGMTVELILTAQDGTSIPTTGDTSVTDAVAGKVRYSPDSTDLVVASSPIQMRWKVTDGGGSVVYHPSGRPAVIVVHAV